MNLIHSLRKEDSRIKKVYNLVNLLFTATTSSESPPPQAKEKALHDMFTDEESASQWFNRKNRKLGGILGSLDNSMRRRV